MRKLCTLIIGIVIVSFLLFTHDVIHAEEIKVDLTVLGCNNNFICEANIGETIGNCSNDCQTPTPTTTPPQSSGGGGTTPPSTSGSSQITITVFSTDITHNSARFNFQTNVFTSASISWGETFDFELGTQANLAASKTHEIFLSGLKPNTRYYYKITNRTENGGQHEFIQEFTTKAIPDTTPPQNLWQINATFKTSFIELTWRNPSDVDFEKILIVRSPQFYPRDPGEGKIIYEGAGNYVRDSDFELGKTYYYTLFSIDDNGNYSSGAVIRITIPLTPGSTPITPPEIPKGGTEYENIYFNDFIFNQDLKDVFVVASTTVTLEADGSFTIRIPEGKLPKTDHILLFTVKDPFKNKEYSFMLKHATSTKEYIGSIYFESKEGNYPCTISIYDAKHQLMTIVDGILDFKASDMDQVRMIERWSKIISFCVGIALILLVLFAIFLGIRKSIKKMSRMV